MSQHTSLAILNIADHRELFVDHFLLEQLDNVHLKMHAPRIENAPPAGGAYNTVIHEAGCYKLYYRKSLTPEKGYTGNLGERVCFAESTDGIHFAIPDLGTGNAENKQTPNVIMDATAFCHNFSPFLDTRPGIPQNERYKALSGIWHNNFGRIRQDGGDLPADFKAGLYTFVSPDGIQWHRTSETPIIASKYKAFDSQNVAFYSESEGCYVCYFRTWGPGDYEKGLRSIARSTSVDFINWTEPEHTSANLYPEELYTSQTAPYFRAPHIALAFPTRFMRDRGSSTDIVFMSTRGGNTFDRVFRDAIVRPGLNKKRWGNRSNYASLNLVPLDHERMCFYMFSPDPDMHTQMTVFRTDGISSLSAGWGSGTAITKLFTFTGDRLELNYSTSASGSIKCELLGEDGRVLEGFSFDDCHERVGDEISAFIEWQGGSLKSISGLPVRLRFSLREADIYSFRFVRGD